MRKSAMVNVLKSLLVSILCFSALAMTFSVSAQARSNDPVVIVDFHPVSVTGILVYAELGGEVPFPFEYRILTESGASIGIYVDRNMIRELDLNVGQKVTLEGYEARATVKEFKGYFVFYAKSISASNYF